MFFVVSAPRYHGGERSAATERPEAGSDFGPSRASDSHPRKMPAANDSREGDPRFGHRMLASAHEPLRLSHEPL
jgi:hypothetical protein